MSSNEIAEGISENESRFFRNTQSLEDILRGDISTMVGPYSQLVNSNTTVNNNNNNG